MNAQKIQTEIQQRYSTEIEYPWARFPEYSVFRHAHHRKWFTILMSVPAYKIGLNSTEKIWVLNVKAKSKEIGSLRMMKGVYPAYHMNKEHWLSLHLGEIDESLLWELVGESFYLTFKK